MAFLPSGAFVWGGCRLKGGGLGGIGWDWECRLLPSSCNRPFTPQTPVPLTTVLLSTCCEAQTDAHQLGHSTLEPRTPQPRESSVCSQAKHTRSFPTSEIYQHSPNTDPEHSVFLSVSPLLTHMHTQTRVHIHTHTPLVRSP